MTEKRYSLRINAKDKGVKIFDNIDEDNWRVLNLHFNNYDDAQFVRSKLIPVVALLNDLSEENEQLKKGMIGVVDRYIKNVECNPPASARTYGKIKGALINIREDLRSLIGDFE